VVTLIGEGLLVLTTPRLTLRTFRADDLPLYAELNADPDVAEHLGGPIDSQTSDEIAEWANQHYAADRLGLLAVQRNEDGRFIGMCGVHEQDWYPDDVEIGWRLARPYWGFGYVTEAAQAWLGYAFDDIGRPRVISITEFDNVRSIAVMHRLGMTFDHSADLPDEETGELFPAVIHSITAQKWRGGGASGPACDCQTRSSPGM
jgi:RimJ/RimL family protein N-acetyltransferase